MDCHNEYYFIGGYDRDGDNQHRWLDGSLVSSGYTKWNTGQGEPNDGGDDYLIIYPYGRFSWSDKPLEPWSRRYICEKGLI